MRLARALRGTPSLSAPTLNSPERLPPTCPTPPQSLAMDFPGPGFPMLVFTAGHRSCSLSESPSRL